MEYWGTLAPFKKQKQNQHVHDQVDINHSIQMCTSFTKKRKLMMRVAAFDIFDVDDNDVGDDDDDEEEEEEEEEDEEDDADEDDED